MDFKKFDLLLKKINTLKQNMDLSDDDVSALEIDLLKNYIRQLYEVVALPDAESIKITQKPKAVEVHIEKPAQAEPEVARTPVIREDKPAEIVPVVETVKEVVIQAEPSIVIPVTENHKTVEYKRVVEEVKTTPSATETKDIKNEQIPEELAEMFSTDPTTDLSDKLSATPLEDIKKAIAINDRILTITELFGGSKDLFEETLTVVNKAQNFETAKEWIISNVAIPLKWTSSDKKGKAKRFIKLVRRRLPH